MVWTPTQTARFLDHAAGDRLYALFHLIAFRGLRRGEACGLHWTEIDWQAKTLTVAWQLVQLGWATELTPPKSDAGERVVALDTDTTDVLAAHRKRQLEERLAWGPELDRHRPRLHPRRRHGAAPSRHHRSVPAARAEAGLPPIRLHDLRHGAATYALAAGADLKVVQEMLGHSTIVLTGDTYTSVLPEVARAAAAGTADLIRRGRHPLTDADAERGNLPARETVLPERGPHQPVPRPSGREGTGMEPEHPETTMDALPPGERPGHACAARDSNPEPAD